MAESGPSVRPVPVWVRAPFDWAQSRQQILLAVVAALQLLVLVVMIVGRVAPLMSGETILLRVRPVDPRDFFRGDYVILSYDFTRVDTSGLSGPGAPAPESRPAAWAGTAVYVPLAVEEDGRHWKAAGPTMLEPPAQGRYIRGEITGYNRATFGIESYFVQEGKGRGWEKAIRTGNLSAEVALAEDGTAALKGLVID